MPPEDIESALRGVSKKNIWDVFAANAIRIRSKAANNALSNGKMDETWPAVLW